MIVTIKRQKTENDRNRLSDKNNNVFHPIYIRTRSLPFNVGLFFKKKKFHSLFEFNFFLLRFHTHVPTNHANRIRGSIV